jgi:hypothetical protein
VYCPFESRKDEADKRNVPTRNRFSFNPSHFFTIKLLQGLVEQESQVGEGKGRSRSVVLNLFLARGTLKFLKFSANFSKILANCFCFKSSAAHREMS